jgi:hypothetical protein
MSYQNTTAILGAVILTVCAIIPLGNHNTHCITARTTCAEQIGAKDELGAAIRQSAKDLGISPEDLATIISFETAGTFDKNKLGPRTKWGRHRGLIQWGEPQARKYGVYFPNMPVGEQMKAVTRYLRDHGVHAGMNGMNVYAAINAGHASRVWASDQAAGGTWGTVRDKWLYQMRDHRRNAQWLLRRVRSSEARLAATVQPERQSTRRVRANPGRHHRRSPWLSTQDVRPIQERERVPLSAMDELRTARG